MGDIAGDVDQLLQNTVHQAIANRESHTFRKNLATEKARVRYGDEIAMGSTRTGPGHTYDTNTASGKSRVQYGNNYGGKSILDD